MLHSTSQEAPPSECPSENKKLASHKNNTLAFRNYLLHGVENAGNSRRQNNANRANKNVVSRRKAYKQHSRTNVPVIKPLEKRRVLVYIPETNVWTTALADAKDFLPIRQYTHIYICTHVHLSRLPLPASKWVNIHRVGYIHVCIHDDAYSRYYIYTCVCVISFFFETRTYIYSRIFRHCTVSSTSRKSQENNGHWFAPSQPPPPFFLLLLLVRVCVLSRDAGYSGKQRGSRWTVSREWFN